MKKFLIAVAMLLSVPLSAQEVQRVSGRDVAIYNLAGEVQIVRGTGSDVVVRITRGGDDASQLRVETGEVRGRQTVRIVYPGDDIVYPPMGRGSNTNRNVRPDGTFSDGGRSSGDRVRISGSGNGLEAWADLVIEVPDNQRASVLLAVGGVQARGVTASLDIDIGAGRVSATNMAGTLSIDTGSGSVVVNGMDGGLSVDTGSGSIEVSDVAGPEVELDTGSGRITARGVRAERLGVDTGSGRIELERIAAPNVIIDTGSGSVDVELLTDVDNLEIDSGSGSVRVVIPSDFGATIEVDTGSGGIDLDVPVEVRSVRRDHMRGVIGDGRGRITIDTGSGSVRFVRN